MSYLLFLPYHLSYKLERAISIVPPGSRTSIIFYLAIYGLFLFLIIRFAFSGFRKFKLKPMHLGISVFVLLMLSIVLKFDLLFLLIPILFFSLLSLLKEKDRNHAFVYILVITGILVSLFCEIFYIKDSLGTSNPDNIRFNTVFKFYIQNWILWGISSGAILFYFRGSFTNRKSWGLIALILIIMASVYPIFATIGKSGGFGGEPTFDGESYIKKEHPADYKAILWFRNLSGQPVVLQAPGEPYQWNTYITAFTGLPTVIGWGGHEITWRLNSSEINKRWSDTGTIYSSLDKEEVIALLKKYNISYIYFGEAEAKKYSPRLFESNPDHFVKVFEYGDVVVFRTLINN
jgi:YYY domain-containing protein